MTAFLRALDEFPGVIQNPKSLAKELVETVEDARKLIEYFKEDKDFESVYRMLLPKQTQQDEILALNQLFNFLPVEILNIGVQIVIEMTQTLEDCHDLLEAFPDHREAITYQAYTLIESIYDCQNFNYYFPASSLQADVLESSRQYLLQEYRACGSTVSCYNSFIDQFEGQGTYDPDGLVNQAKNRIPYLESMNTFARAVGVKMVKCCSWLGAKDISPSFDESGIREDKILGHTKIPMTIYWTSVADGNRYWVQGEVLVTKSGKYSWLAISNSGGLIPGCTYDCNLNR